MAKKKKSSFRGRVKNDVEKQKKAASSYGYLNLPKGVSVYSPTPGSREKFDVLPYEVSVSNHPDKNGDFPDKGDMWYKRPFKVHRQIGADNESVVCLASFGKKCPICEYRKKLAKEEADEDTLKALKPSNRNLYYIIPRGIKKLEEEPHVFDFSQYLFQDLLNDEIEEDEDNEVFPDLEEGLTLKVRWEEKTFSKNKYAEASRIDFISRDDEIEESIIEDLPSLDTILEELSYEEMYAKFHEIDVEDVEEDDEDEEDEDEKPKRKSKKSSTKKKVKDEDEDEDEDEEDDEDEDEDEDEDKDTPDLDWEDLADMNITELLDVVEEYELEVDTDEVDSAEELAKLIAEEIGVDVPKPKRKSTKKSSTKKSTKKTESKKSIKKKCPAGHKWGKDHDATDDCEDCPMWDDCLADN